MAFSHFDLVDSVNSGQSDPQPSPAPTPREVLEELFILLEEYAPAWYTEQHHNRAVAALLGRQS